MAAPDPRPISRRVRLHIRFDRAIRRMSLSWPAGLRSGRRRSGLDGRHRGCRDDITAMPDAANLRRWDGKAPLMLTWKPRLLLWLRRGCRPGGGGLCKLLLQRLDLFV